MTQQAAFSHAANRPPLRPGRGPPAAAPWRTSTRCRCAPRSSAAPRRAASARRRRPAGAESAPSCDEFACMRESACRDWFDACVRHHHLQHRRRDVHGAEQDAAIAFYAQILGWALRTDVAFGDERATAGSRSPRRGRRPAERSTHRWATGRPAAARSTSRRPTSRPSTSASRPSTASRPARRWAATARSRDALDRGSRRQPHLGRAGRLTPPTSTRAWFGRALCDIRTRRAPAAPAFTPAV